MTTGHNATVTVSRVTLNGVVDWGVDDLPRWEDEPEFGEPVPAAPVRIEPVGDLAEIYRVYYATHVLCPRCLSRRIELPSPAMLWGATEPPFIDGTSVTCRDCNWRGMTDDLQPPGLSVPWAPRTDWSREGF